MQNQAQPLEEPVLETVLSPSPNSVPVSHSVPRLSTCCYACEEFDELCHLGNGSHVETLDFSEHVTAVYRKNILLPLDQPETTSLLGNRCSVKLTVTGSSSQAGERPALSHQPCKDTDAPGLSPYPWQVGSQGLLLSLMSSI